MCLIVFAWQVMPDVPLVAASNRDEFYARPALPAHRWEDTLKFMPAVIWKAAEPGSESRTDPARPDEKEVALPH